jgi:Dolichyl-phosphate-mannose-protein mannosyltransferase
MIKTKQPPTRRNLPPWVLLTAIYVLSVALHFVSLRRAAEFPLLATDEVQYISVGENLRLGHGFTTRGEFHTGLPPFYPLFVAFTHSLGTDPRMTALFFSCIVICLVVFPAYGLARHTGLDRRSAYFLAAAAAFLPHTLLSGMYMTETISYPLFVAAFWCFARWLEQPTRPRALIAGALLSAMLLTKIAAWSFAAAVLTTVLIVSIRGRKEQRPGLSALWVFAIVAITQFAWLAFKHAHGASLLGVYGVEFQERGLLQFSKTLMTVFLADFLLAPGLLTAVPLFLWFRRNGKQRFALAVLLGSTLFLQIAIHGVLEAGISGFLKERLLLYSIAIMAIFAVKGMEELPSASLSTKFAFVMAPLILLAVVSLYGFPYNPVIDVPWASAIGSFAWKGVATFTRRHMMIISAFTIVVAGISIAFVFARRVKSFAALLILIFFGGIYASGAKEMDELSRAGRIDTFHITKWLASKGLRPDDRLVICGNMAAYQESHRITPLDDFFIDWQRDFGLTDITILQLEAAGRYDVRIARTPNLIRTVLRPGDHLLSATRITDLDLVSFQYPFYLYVLNKNDANPKTLYTIDLTADVEYEQSPYMMLGQPVLLPPGRYRATLYLTAEAGAPLVVDVIAKRTGTVAAHLEARAGQIKSFDFASPGDEPLQFRLSGAATTHAQFHDAVIERLP